MIYGAVAAAMVLVLVMRRGSGSSAAAGAQDPNSAALTPVSSPALDTGSYGAGVGPDYSSQLADFESQLSTVVGQAVANGMAAQPTPGAGDPSPTGPAAVTINVGNGTGQQVGGGAPSPSSPAPSAAARPHPSLHERVAGAETAHQQMYRSPQSHAVLAQRAQGHPGWGPHTIAAGHKLKGHSVRF